MSYKTLIWFTGSRAILESDALTPLCSVAHTSEGARASCTPDNFAWGRYRPFLIDKSEIKTKKVTLDCINDEYMNGDWNS